MSLKSLTVLVLALYLVGLTGSVNPITLVHCLFLVGGTFLLDGGYRWLWILYKTLPRDIMIAWVYSQITRTNAQIRKAKKTTAQLFVENVAKNPNKTAIIFEDTRWSYTDIDQYSNRVGNFVVKKGVQRQGTVAIFMENCPEYIATWVGCAKVGVISALINSNLRKTPLLHSIKIVEPKFVVCSAELQEAITEIKDDLTASGIEIFISYSKEKNLPSEDFKNFNEELNKCDPFQPDRINEGNMDDRLLYIYTSGTTGLPKAAVIKDNKYALYAIALNKLLDMKPESIVYNPLPLYHTAGGIIGAGQVVVANATIVIRKKFSVSNYWREVGEYKCDVAQYIGEMCRYLLNSPTTPYDTTHNVRVMVGNGLRRQIWNDFVDRFKVPKITEIYGATEGVCNLANYNNHPGACGHLPVLFMKYFPGKLIKMNGETGQPSRTKDGLCILCKPGESGQYIAVIKNDNVLNFEGYANKSANSKKIIHDVMRKGDTAYLSGDMLEMDEFGYLYFKDRLGDTFRWRGENVSTTEVEGVVSLVAKNKDSVVYGVQVPGVEGRAGMAAVVDPEKEIKMESFAQELRGFLPQYAMPLFIQRIDQIDITGTYKLRKIELKKQSYDPKLATGELYFLDYKLKSYVPLTNEIYEKILSANAGL